jgi:tetratricopeptide (TPR) repeat protein
MSDADGNQIAEPGAEHAEHEAAVLGIESNTDGKLLKWFSVVVSAVALGLAIYSTHEAMSSNEAAQDASRQHELATLVTQLNGVVRLRIHTTVSRALTSAEKETLLGRLASSEAVAAETAMTIVRKNPSDANQAEYLAIGLADEDTTRYDDAREMLQRSVQAAADPVSRGNSLRALAWLDFFAKHFRKGRSEYQQALNIYPSSTLIRVAPVENDVFTEAQWSTEEAGAGNCSAAETHLTAATDELQQLPTSAPQLYSLSLSEAKRVAKAC